MWWSLRLRMFLTEELSGQRGANVISANGDTDVILHCVYLQRNECSSAIFHCTKLLSSFSCILLSTSLGKVGMKAWHMRSHPVKERIKKKETALKCQWKQKMSCTVRWSKVLVSRMFLPLLQCFFLPVTAQCWASTGKVLLFAFQLNWFLQWHNNTE